MLFRQARPAACSEQANQPRVEEDLVYEAELPQVVPQPGSPGCAWPTVHSVASRTVPNSGVEVMRRTGAGVREQREPKVGSFLIIGSHGLR